MNRTKPWEYCNPVQIVFGCGRLPDLRTFRSGRSLVVTSPGMTRRGATMRVTDIIAPDSALVFDRVQPNPQLDLVAEAVQELKAARIDTVIALGGGSSLDVAKALSLMLSCPSLALRAAVDGTQSIDGVQPLPLIAIPTTAGTGSEVTPFATFWDPVHRSKHSLSSPKLFPEVALLDPELTLSLPWPETLASGLDAYSQCFESIWNRNASPLTITLAQRGLALVPAALRRLQTDLGSIDARSDMLEASLLSGLAISRTRTALAHSISYPITASWGLPHGLACAFTLPAILAFNLQSDDGRLANLATSTGFSDPEILIRSVVDLLRDLEVPGAVRQYVPEYDALYDMAPQMLTPGRADNNLRPVTVEAVREILQTAGRWLFGA